MAGIVKCSKCGRTMIEKNGKYGKFLACPGYPKCRNTMQIKNAAPPVPKIERKQLHYTPEQAEIINHFKDHPHEHLVIDSLAGTGKTTISVELAYEMEPSAAIAAVCFNRKPADELKARMPEYVSSSTWHSFSNALLRKAMPRVKFNIKKLDNTLELLIPAPQWQRGVKFTKQERKEFAIAMSKRSAVKKFVSLCKSTMQLAPTDEELEEIRVKYSIDTHGDTSELFHLARQALNITLANRSEIDFDDQVLFLAHYADFNGVKPLDYLIIDEYQDMAFVNQKIAQKVAKTVIAVGDMRQAIYGFRGADVNTLATFNELLDIRNHMQLTVSQRCSRAVVALAQRIVPDFKASNCAREGSVVSISTMPELDGDTMLLARTNTPLVGEAMNLLDQGIKFSVTGSGDFSDALKNLIRMSDTDTADEFVDFINDYEEKQMKKFGNRKGVASAKMMLADKCATLRSMATRYGDTETMIDAIDRLFVESNDQEAVLLTTAHRGKGLEAEKVIILDPDNFPHPMADLEWEKVQESNLCYVACTRSKDVLMSFGALPKEVR